MLPAFCHVSVSLDYDACRHTEPLEQIPDISLSLVRQRVGVGEYIFHVAANVNGTAIISAIALSNKLLVLILAVKIYHAPVQFHQMLLYFKNQ